MNNTFLLKNITVIDPEKKIRETKDIYVLDGKISDEVPERDAPTLDMTDAFVAPGLIDIHTHVFEEHAYVNINADKIGVQQGVLQVVDAGSTGINDFKLFEEIVSKNVTDVLFFLNISKIGLTQPGGGELKNMDNIMTGEELSNFQKEHGKNMVGLKVRMSGTVVGENDIKPLILARELSDKSGLPLMIHIGNGPPELGAALDLLKAGDIVTHCFHGKPSGIPQFPKEYKAALARGVHFDVGHGRDSFAFPRVREVLDIADMDYTISTDLYEGNYETPVRSLMHTMTKFIPLGVALEDLVRKTSALPRTYLKQSQYSMKMGATANLSVFRIAQRACTLVDSMKNTLDVKEVIEPILTIKDGKQVWKRDA